MAGLLLGKRVGAECRAAAPVDGAANGLRLSGVGSSQRSAEDRLHGVHGRALDRDLDVVPGRAVAVLLGERLRLRVTGVVGVVAAVVREVDAADVGHVAGRVVAVADHHELLVVRPAGAHAHVEQHLGAAVLQLLPEVPVLGGEEAGLVEVGAPHQPAHVDPALVGPAEDLGDLAAGVAGQPLVGVALPVGEQHQVTRLVADRAVQVGEVGRAVDEREHQVVVEPGAVPSECRR